MTSPQVAKKSLRWRYYRFVAWLTYGPLWWITTSFYFLTLAWKALRGQIGIISSDETRSRGGYKYFCLIISKLPVSTQHTYEDL